MKKNYFLSLVCLLASVLFGTSAMAESITDVYGTYTFTATMTVASGQDASLLSDNCDVTISKDNGNIYLGYIDGIAGSTTGGHAISNYTDGQLVIKNMNDYNTGNFSKPIYFSVVSNSDKTKGYNPFGGTEMPDWKMTVNAETGEITIPDFVIVSVSNYNDSLATIVATFTNAKLTLKEKEKTDVPDIAGSYTYTHGGGTYDYNQNSSFSPDYSFLLIRNDETNKNYTAKFTFDGQLYAELPATFDGVTVSAPFDSIYLSAKDSIRLGSINGMKKGTISFSYVKAGILSAYSGFCIARDSISPEMPDSIFQWYINGTAKDPDQIKGDDVDFTGTYTVVAKYMTPADSWASTTDDTFTFTVKKDDYGYYVSEWGEYNEILYGGLSAKVDADNSSKLCITPSYLKFISTDEEMAAGTYKYITLTDMNGSYSDIVLTANADGTFTLDQFATANATYGESTIGDFIRYYSTISSVTKGVEPTPAATIADTYKYTGTYCTTENPTGVEKSFYITIEENTSGYGSKYMVTYFDGDGIVAANYGGASLTITDESAWPVTCTMAAGTLLGTAANCDFDNGVYTYNAAYDINGSDENAAVTITLNQDGTCSMSDFSIYVYDYGTWAKTDLVGWYSNGTLVREAIPTAIQSVAAQAATRGTLYNLAGQRVAKAQKGIVIRDGKKVLVK